MSDETQTPDAPEQQPLLRVVKGDPTPEELAALVAVIAARNAAAAAAEGDAPQPRSQWGHPTRQHRTVHRFGRGQWRASAW